MRNVAIVLTGLTLFSSSADAGIMFQPVDVTESWSRPSWSTSRLPSTLISQAGLETKYVSGVTLSDSFESIHNSSSDEWIAYWRSTAGNLDLPGHLTFDMGEQLNLDAFHYWGSSWSGTAGAFDVKDFELFADTDMDFENGASSLGSFETINTENSQNNNINPHVMQTFDFAKTSTQYIHMRIYNRHGNNTTPGSVSFSEAAFSGASVPEPTSLALLAVVGVLTIGRRRRSD